MLVYVALIFVQSAHGISWTCSYFVSDQQTAQEQRQNQQDCVSRTISELNGLGCGIDGINAEVEMRMHSEIDSETAQRWYSQSFRVQAKSDTCFGAAVKRIYGHAPTDIDVCKESEKRIDLTWHRTRYRASSDNIFRKDFARRSGSPSENSGANFFCIADSK